MTVALPAQLNGFFEAIGKDEAAVAKLKAALEAADDPVREVIGQAAALGFTVTEDDIKTMQQVGAEKPLSDDDLDQVGGGHIIMAFEFTIHYVKSFFHNLRGR